VKIGYSYELINEVHVYYPDDIAMHKLAEEGHEALIIHLEDNIPIINPEDILNAKSLEELKEKAKILIHRKELYQKCADELNAIYKKYGRAT
jgi:hypothetical protein